MQTKCNLDRVTLVLSLADDCDDVELCKQLSELGLEGRNDDGNDTLRIWYYKRCEGNVTRTVLALFKNRFQDSWRLDTSYHFEDERDRQILYAVVHCFKYVHFSRLDIAFDFINGNKPNMAHRVYRWGTSEKVLREDTSATYRGPNKDIETIYWGSRKSQKQIRYYDKLKEQKKAHKKVPADVRQWERLELQLRGDKADEWVKSAYEMLEQFKLPRIGLLKPQQRAMLSALDSGLVEWSELTPNTRTKYRRLLDENDDFDIEYAETAKEVLQDSLDEIQIELNTLLSWVGAD